MLVVSFGAQMADIRALFAPSSVKMGCAGLEVSAVVLSMLERHFCCVLHGSCRVPFSAMKADPALNGSQVSEGFVMAENFIEKSPEVRTNLTSLLFRDINGEAGHSHLFRRVVLIPRDTLIVLL